MRIACIGTRSIVDKPTAINACRWTGVMIVGKGHYIASGNAVGADYAFAQGGNAIDPKKVILYLPKEHHNREHIVAGNRMTWEAQESWKEIARKHHPAYDKLKPYIQSLMDRNAGILSRADRCIAWLDHEAPGFGGTGHGWRIAGDMGIPRFDLSQVTTFEEIRDFLA